MLDAGGTVHIESGTLTQTPDGDDGLPRICMAARRTDPEDRFLFHKTTNRGLYDRAFAAASKEGFADALFLNTRGEVTEGAISNVFIEEGRPMVYAADRLRRFAWGLSAISAADAARYRREDSVPVMMLTAPTRFTPATQYEGFGECDRRSDTVME